MHKVPKCPHSVPGEGAAPGLHDVIMQERLVVIESAGVRRHDVAQEGGSAPPGGGDQGPNRLPSLLHHQAGHGFAIHGLKPGQVLSQEPFLSGYCIRNLDRQGRVCLK